jgi:hypothetical protein
MVLQWKVLKSLEYYLAVYFSVNQSNLFQSFVIPYANNNAE